jgi:hypothetical protein
MQHAARATALLEPGRRRLEGVVAAAGLPLPRGGLSLMHLLGAVVAVVAAAEVYLSSWVRPPARPLRGPGLQERLFPGPEHIQYFIWETPKRNILEAPKRAVFWGLSRGRRSLFGRWWRS